MEEDPVGVGDAEADNLVILECWRMSVQLLIIARDKLALLVLSTNRFQYIPFQYIPRVLAVLVGVRQPRRR